ncbi:MAG: hypothetical protein ACLSHO_10960 [Dysosmobacter sp.]
MADLKGTLERRVKRNSPAPPPSPAFRPHHFPSPSRAARWISVPHSAAARAAPTCKGEGWIEVLGAGMVHPGCSQLRHRPG